MRSREAAAVIIAMTTTTIKGKQPFSSHSRP
jgi:hypothetical protein